MTWLSGLAQSPHCVATTGGYLLTNLPHCAWNCPDGRSFPSQLWVFNPYVRILSNSPYFTSDVPISAAKILYRTLADLESDGETGIPHLLGNSESDALILPRSACLHLAKTLADSTEVYPKSQRKLGEWTVGWLERAQ